MQVYFTIPLTIIYWLFIPTENMTGDAMVGYILFGMMITLGTIKDWQDFRIKLQKNKEVEDE